MAEPVIVPVQLVTDLDMSNVNWKDAEKQISKSLSGVRKAINDAFKGIDASAINKPIEQSVTKLAKGLQTLEDAHLKYQETLIKAGKSTAKYKGVVSELDAQIKEQAANHEQITQSLKDALDERDKFAARAKEDPNNMAAEASWKRWSNIAKTRYVVFKESQAQLQELQSKRNEINPIDFIDKDDPIQLAKITNSFNKLLSAQDELNSRIEATNQTVHDNRMSDEYQELVKQAEAYKTQLEGLNEKSKEMEFKGATDKQWENLRKNAEWTSLKLDEVLKKMRSAAKSGTAFRFGDGDKNEVYNQASSFAMSAKNRLDKITERSQKNQSPYTEEYQKALNDLDKLEKKIEAIKEKSAKMIELGASKQQFQNLAYDAEQLDLKVEDAKTGLINMVMTGKAFRFGNGDNYAEISNLVSKSGSLQSTLTEVATNAKKAQGGLTALGTTHPKLAAVLGVVGKIATGFGKVVATTAKVGKAILTGAVGAFQKLRNVVSKAGSAMTSFFGRRASSSHSSGIKKLTRNILMWGFGFRTAYYAIKRLRTIFVEGFQIMGDKFDEVGEPMKRMIESFNRLKGSLATAFQPLVTIAMPILTKVMNYLSGMLESIGKFNAVLTGQGYIYKAVAKNINSVANAAKNANNQLGSYDKLEVIQDSSGYDYEKTAIDSSKEAVDSASKFANMVKEAWEKADFTSVGHYVTEQLLAVLDNVERNIVPKAVGFANRVLLSVNTFLMAFDTTAIGDKFGSIITTIVDGLQWDQIGLLFANLNNTVWGFLDGLVNGIDWTVVGQSISTGLVSLVSNLDFNSLAGIYAGLTTGIVTAITLIDWGTIATKLLEGLYTMFSTVGNAMASSDNPLLASVGEMVLSIREFIYPIADIIYQAISMALPVLLSLFQAIMPILLELTAAVLPMILDVMTSLQPIFDAITNTILPVVLHALEVFMPLLQSILGLITNLLAPIMSLLGPLIEIVFNIIDTLIILLEPVISVLTTLCDLIGAVLRPILDALTPVLSAVNSLFEMLRPILEILISPFNFLADVIKFVSGILTGTLVPVIDIVMGIIELLANVIQMVGNTFTFVFGSIQVVIEGFGNAIKGVLNGILGGIESFVNGLIKGINTAIKALNKLSFDVPDWVPGIGGKKFGFNIKEISTIKIPKLAQGAVIPPNKEFLAMLGDQKHGTNIEAPLDTIKQALAEVLAEIGGGNREPIILQVNGRTLAKVVWDEQEKRYKQTGKA